MTNFIKKMVLSAAVLALPYSAMAQVWGGDDHRERREDRDNNNGRYNNNSDFNQGYQQGRVDAANGVRRNGRAAGNGQYRAGYEQGYRAAMQSSRNGTWRNNGTYGNNGAWGNNNGTWRRGNGDNDADDQGYGRNGTYNNGQYGVFNRGGSYANSAVQQGIVDGQYDGQNDRANGHSFRPTEHNAYKNADHGQSVSGISRDQYKQLYRQSYERGYQQGYNGGGGYGRY